MKKFQVMVDYNNIMSVLEVLERHGIGWRVGEKATEYNPFEDEDYILEKCQTIRLLYKKKKGLLWVDDEKLYKKYKSYTVGDIINERFVEISYSDDNSTKFDYDKIMKPNVAVWCDEEWKANELLKWADSKGLKWGSGLEYIERNYYNMTKDKTCYYIYDGTYADLECFKDNNYTIYKYEDVLAVKDKFDGNLIPQDINKESYYIVDSTGVVFATDFELRVDYRLKQGNAFKTKEDAEKVLKYIEEVEDEQDATAKWIRNYVAINDDGWRANWNDGDQVKYCIYYDYGEKIYRKYNGYLLRDIGTTTMSNEMADKILSILNGGDK